MIRFLYRLLLHHLLYGRLLLGALDLLLLPLLLFTWSVLLSSLLVPLLDFLVLLALLLFTLRFPSSPFSTPPSLWHVLCLQESICPTRTTLATPALNKSDIPKDERWMVVRVRRH